MANEEIKYMKLRTRNAKMMKLYGDKLTKSEWARSMRTNGLHTEIQFSDRYGGISASCTLSDGCNGMRLKPNKYTHPYRWSTIYIPVTAEQETRLFIKACEMADLPMFPMSMHLISEPSQEITEGYKHGECYYGPNHTKYDKGAAFFSFISKRNIWKPSKTKMICNRACGEVLMVVWPGIFEIKKYDATVLVEYTIEAKPENEWEFTGGRKIYPSIPPHEQTPDQTEYMVRHYVDSQIKPLK